MELVLGVFSLCLFSSVGARANGGGLFCVFVLGFTLVLDVLFAFVFDSKNRKTKMRKIVFQNLVLSTNNCKLQNFAKLVIFSFVFAQKRRET